jgi:hypothetical protein
MHFPPSSLLASLVLLSSAACSAQPAGLARVSDGGGAEVGQATLRRGGDAFEFAVRLHDHAAFPAGRRSAVITAVAVDGTRVEVARARLSALAAGRPAGRRARTATLSAVVPASPGVDHYEIALRAGR